MIWLSPSTLPNLDGYRVVLRLKTGERKRDVVACDAEGQHTLRDTPITDVAGWVSERAYLVWESYANALVERATDECPPTLRTGEGAEAQRALHRRST